MDQLLIRLYRSVRVVHASGESRTYWATDSRYRHTRDGFRRDMVEIDLGNNKRGMAQLISFLKMENPPLGAQPGRYNHAVVVRWMSPSSISGTRDDYGRPLCGWPLSSNHCLWEWTNAGTVRSSFLVRGFLNTVNRHHMWDHIPVTNRRSSIDSEKRARYDVLEYSSIICYANTSVDPSTGHVLQTIQMI